MKWKTLLIHLMLFHECNHKFVTRCLFLKHDISPILCREVRTETVSRFEDPHTFSSSLSNNRYIYFQFFGGNFMASLTDIQVWF